MGVRVDVVSIGTLSRNRLWGEATPVRTPHATTTLVRADAPGAPHGGEVRILVDPGLPAPALEARLYERTGLRPADVGIVFLTCFRPAHRDAVGLFAHADWLLHADERDAVGGHLGALLDRTDDSDVRGVLEREMALLARCEPPEDTLAPGVDLFPLAGYTPGTCGLLIPQPTQTVLVAGDAVPTREHLLASQMLPDAWDMSAARESMREASDIADVIIPGHDNLFMHGRNELRVDED